MWAGTYDTNGVLAHIQFTAVLGKGFEHMLQIDFMLQSVVTACKTLPRRQVTAAKYRHVSTLFNDAVGTLANSVIFMITPGEVYAMARFNDKTFSTLRLDLHLEQAYSEWVQQNNVVPVELLAELCGEGYKISISWVFDQNSFCASLIGTPTTKANEDVVMTTWSDDLPEVIAMMYYKHVVICDRGKWPTEKSGNRWG